MLISFPSLKQVIDGKAYNTETATLIHQRDLEVGHPYDPDQFPHCEELYRTRFGKFFLVERNEAFLNRANGDIDLRDQIFPLELNQAMKWMEEQCNEKIELFMEVAEAGEPSTTLTLRMDKTLKISLNAAAINEGVSMNVWCVRALQKAVEKHEV